ncbi:TIGR04053 family radical SAM/SPASM domain-containing protein [Gorillibacterium sp. sgz5001074]|uniref:TIGR04053 family radical SAM/SPASM domain-containing protein n=1 Tax=Gorillibacterium sp. sgz5001074 TaxID=3446695 RepID=UPI003F66B50E
MIAADYNQNPFIVVWEVTRACALNCLHCRAEAQHRRHPMELSTEEGKRLLDEIQSMDSPLFVFTGGDPLMRDDLFELASYAKSIGLRTSITPSATPRVTEEAMRKAVDIGLDRWAFSLDGSTAEIHDRFRGTSGSFDLTMRSLATLRKLGMPLQINTTVCEHNKRDLQNIADMLGEMGVVMWSVFFLVPTGRGKEDDMITPEEGEEILHWLAELGEKVSFGVKTTAAPFYRRVLAQRAKAAGKPPEAAAGKMIGVPAFATTTGKSPFGAGDGKAAMRAPRGVTDGSGFVFVSHTGDISPSGFLPLDCGNVRDMSLAQVYREHPVFTGIRQPELYAGKCGVCEYRGICGGSRARAYTATGDYMGSDPACAYQPDEWVKLQASV